jgi:hypothetical protein
MADSNGTDWGKLFAVLIGGAIAIAGSITAYQIQQYDLKKQAINTYIGDLEAINGNSLLPVIEHENISPMNESNVCNPDGTANISGKIISFPDHWPGKIYPDWGYFNRGSSEIGRFNDTLSDRVFSFYTNILIAESIRDQFDNFDEYYPVEASNLQKSNNVRGLLYAKFVCKVKKASSEIPELKDELRKEAKPFWLS